jgi:ABC-type glycerol-3-phosphate transport system substrate-binding protein
MLPEEMDEEMEEDHGDVKVKIIKMDSGNTHEMMNDILGPMSPKVM